MLCWKDGGMDAKKVWQSREKMKQVLRMGYGRLTMLSGIPNAAAGYIPHSMHAAQDFSLQLWK
jgi:hypothetical protein